MVAHALVAVPTHPRVSTSLDLAILRFPECVHWIFRHEFPWFLASFDGQVS